MAAMLTKTHCPYCSLQCGIELDVSGGSVVLTPQDDFPTNRGGLCAKGCTAAELLGHPDRLTQPLVRDGRGSPLRPATWNEALERIVAAFQTTQREYGRDAVGCFGGGGLTNEKAYQFGKFARVALRTSAIDYNGRFCMSWAAAASIRSFGIDGGCRSRWLTSRTPTSCSSSAATPPKLCRPRCSFSTRAVPAAPSTSSSTRGAPRPPRGPTCTCNRSPAPIWRWPTACLTSPSGKA
jgi:hypothetical protein